MRVIAFAAALSFAVGGGLGAMTVAYTITTPTICPADVPTPAMRNFAAPQHIPSTGSRQW
jgi:hypothetical protein